MKLRKAVKEDIPKIRKLDQFGRILNRCSPLDRLDPYHKTKKGEKNYYEKFLYGKNKWCYVAEDEEKHKLLGFLLFKVEKREPWWKIKEVGYIDLVFIDKKARKKGLAKLLFKKAYEIFKEKRLSYVKLSVQTDNALAHNVWKKWGFKDFRVDMYKKI